MKCSLNALEVNYWLPKTSFWIPKVNYHWLFSSQNVQFFNIIAYLPILFLIGLVWFKLKRIQAFPHPVPLHEKWSLTEGSLWDAAWKAYGASCSCCSFVCCLGCSQIPGLHVLFFTTPLAIWASLPDPYFPPLCGSLTTVSWKRLYIELARENLAAWVCMMDISQPPG